MPFPISPSDQDKHIVNQDTFQFNAAKNRWELIDDLDATELNLDSEIHERKSADSDLRHLLAQVDSDLAILFARTDSDEGSLQILETAMVQRIDSERHDWKSADSDLRVNIDSERHAWKSADSDLLVRIVDNDSDIQYLYNETLKFRGTVDPTTETPPHTAISAGDFYISRTSGAMAIGWDGVEGFGVSEGNALLYTDSDKWVFLGGGLGSADLDSEIHERMAADSDLYVLVNSHIDSEELARKSADSDLSVLVFVALDSETHDRKAADSDLSVLVFTALDSETHDRKAADSDLTALVVSGLDSEIHDRKAGDSDLRNTRTLEYYGILAGDYEAGDLRVQLDNAWNFISSAPQSGPNYGWVRHTPGGGQLRTWIILNGELALAFDNWDTEVTVDGRIYRRGATERFQDLIYRDGNQELIASQIYDIQIQDRRVNGIGFFDDREATRDQFDSDIVRNFKKISSSVNNIDSDLQLLVAQKLKEALDSETHDRKAADSDIINTTLGTVTSRRVEVSESQGTALLVNPDDNGTITLTNNIFGEITGANNITGTLNAWFTIAGGQFTNIQANHNVIVYGGKLVHEGVDANFDKTYHDVNDHTRIHRLGQPNPFVNVSVRNGTQVQNNIPRAISVSKRQLQWSTVDVGQQVRKNFDSDIRTSFSVIARGLNKLDSEIHAIREYDLDSDIAYIKNEQKAQWIRIKRNDSDINIARHDFEADDSDLAIRITNNDSDIAYLQDLALKLRGTVDVTIDGPRHLPEAPGDVYIALTAGTMGAGWGDQTGILSVKANDVILYTDSEQWIKLGSGGAIDSDLTANRLFLNDDSESGMLTWNPDEHTVDITLNSEVTLQVGQETTIFAKNRTGFDIPNGTVVRIDGSSGDQLTIAPANVDSEYGTVATVGVTTQFIGDNNTGFVTLVGKVRGLNTAHWAPGDVLWLDSEGGISSGKPLSPKHLVHVGYVVRSHANDGIIWVKIDNGYELEELHDVLITEPVTGGKHLHVIAWDSDVNLWRNVKLNADYGVF